MGRLVEHSFLAHVCPDRFSAIQAAVKGSGTVCLVKHLCAPIVLKQTLGWHSGDIQPISDPRPAKLAEFCFLSVFLRPQRQCRKISKLVNPRLYRTMDFVNRFGVVAVEVPTWWP